MEVDGVARRIEEVTRVSGRDLDPLAVAEGVPQPQDVVLQGLAGRPRRVVTPRCVDERGVRDNFSSAQGEDREECPLLRSAQRDRPVLPVQLHGAQESESSRHIPSVAIHRPAVHRLFAGTAVTWLRSAGVHFRAEIVTGVGGRQIIVEDPSGTLSSCSNRPRPA